MNKGTWGLMWRALVASTAIAFAAWYFLLKPLLDMGVENRAISDKWDRLADGGAQ